VPVRKVGKDCYQWGNQKVYCGKGAKEKAIKQGIAIENTGWMEAEEIDIGTLHTEKVKTAGKFILPPSFEVGMVQEWEFKRRKFYLHQGYLLISTDEEGKWRVWDLDSQDFRGWNTIGSPFFPSKNQGPNFPLTRPHIYQFDTVDDAITHAEWVHEDRIKNVKKWFKNPELQDYIAVGLISGGKLAALRAKMTKEDIDMARHPNRSESWLPTWIVKELVEELRVKMVCPTCGEKVFHSLLAAQRHHFYCEKYGIQPNNNLYMTPIELLIASMKQKKALAGGKEAEETKTNWPIIALVGVGLVLSIPYFLDSRGNKV